MDAVAPSARGMRGSVALLALAAGLVASDWPTERAAPELPPWFGDRSAPPVVIRGVVHSDRLPLTVRLAIEVADPGIWPGLEVQTDAAGRFDFGPQRRGHYRIHAFGPLDASRDVAVSARNGDVAVDVFSYPCRELTGRVVLAPREGFWYDDHLPLIAGAQLEILGRTVATSDAAGQFRFCGPRDDAWFLARAPGASSSYNWAFSDVHDFRVDPLVVGLHDGVSVDGVVVDAAGQPVPGVGVQPVFDPRMSHAGPHPAPVTTTTDERGAFRLEGLHEGVYFFGILDGARSVTIPHEVPDGIRLPAQGPLRLVVPAPEPARTARSVPREGDGVWIRGRVLHDGKPVPDATLTGEVHGRGRPEQNGGARSAADGSFAIFAPTSGFLFARPYTIEVVHAGLDLRGRTAVELEPDGPDRAGVVIEVGRHKGVTGVVVDPQGNPLAGIVVARFTPDRRSEGTDATGAFRAPIDASQTFRLRAFDAAGDELLPPAGIVAPRVRAELFGREAPPIRFVVDPTPPRIRGVVVDERGAPVRARVRNLGSGDKPVDTDERGELALAPSLYFEAPAIVAAEAVDGRVAYQQDVYIETPVRLTLRRPARLVVPCRAGLNRREMISVAQGAFEQWVRCGEQLERLPPGRFQIVAHLDDGDAIASVDLRAGVRTRHTLAISPRRTIRARAVELPGGAPVQGADCTAVTAEARRSVLVGRNPLSATDGTFSLMPAEARLRLTCEHPRFIGAETAPFDVSTVDGVIDVPMVRQRLDAVDLDVDVRPHPLGAVVIAVSDELAAAGLRAGDIVETVDGVPLAGLDPDSVTELAFRRPAGAELTWEVRRGAERVTVRAP
jgi:uncharacterized GH25 family protein